MSIKSLHSVLKDVFVIRISAVLEAFEKIVLQKYIQTNTTAIAIRAGLVIMQHHIVFFLNLINSCVQLLLQLGLIQRKATI